jgi:hypothetical protein
MINERGREEHWSIRAKEDLAIGDHCDHSRMPASAKAEQQGPQALQADRRSVSSCMFGMSHSLAGRSSRETRVTTDKQNESLGLPFPLNDTHLRHIVRNPVHFEVIAAKMFTASAK